MEAITLHSDCKQQIHQTQFLYGKDVQQSVGPLLREQKANSVLVLCGIEALRRTGWYKQMLQSLRQTKLTFWELGGIEYQAQLEQIETGITLCKKQQVDYILAVGGGSVIDSAKAIAMGALCDQCIWSYFTTEQRPEAALPVSVLLTIPGSGSENNDQAMITNDDTLLKLSCRSAVLQPQYCLINPEIFYTISQEQLAHATVIILHRIICDYLLRCRQGADQKQLKRLEEGMRLLMRKARQLQTNRFDDDAWNQLVLLDSRRDTALETGKQEDSCQRMAAELSSMCQVPYGAVLAVLLPAWMQFISQKNQQELMTFSQNVMGISAEFPAETQISEGIMGLQKFFRELQLADNLCALGIQQFCFKNIAQICTGYGWGQERPSGVLQTLYWQDLYQIYQSVYRQPVLEELYPA